ncbi:proline dehydrogenase family protein [Bacillus taeanensis]|uniref:proline dehydrogenase n=1 Tax=Bacillus taeanensis TaxID=273032 RepID=A0A366Y2M2_9BACI|nr:proline dehydrogenase [Bacillus taeanensis]RBW71249.1 proline dehydrogenase [Bacillus taeanensis]
MEQMMRNVFLFLGKNKVCTTLAKKYGLRFGAGRFVAGASLESTVNVIRELNEKGLDATIDHLGEFITTKQETKEMVDHCIKAVQTIRRENLNSQLSLKLTSLGLDIDQELALENMRNILREAQKHNVFVTIDMEDEPRCQATLDLFKELRKDFDCVGTVIQAYLYRSLGDIHDLKDYNPNLRLVKGAYKEPKEVAFPKKDDVDSSFKKMIKAHLLNGNYTAVATHDDAIIDYTKQLIKEHDIPHDQFEFQMLYGICVERQLQLAEEGYRMRVYIPYGKDWYGYFMRRLAERPANVTFVLKGVFGK